MAVEYFVQNSANACVPACLFMVLRARGHQVGVDRLVEELQPGPRGVAFSRAVVALSIVSGILETPDPTDVRTMVWLRAQLRSVCLLVVQVFSAEMRKVGASRGLAAGPWGELPDRLGLLHAIVLVAARHEDFVVHDPWFDRGQPMTLQATELAAALQGDVIVVPPR